MSKRSCFRVLQKLATPRTETAMSTGSNGRLSGFFVTLFSSIVSRVIRAVSRSMQSRSREPAALSTPSFTGLALALFLAMGLADELHAQGVSPAGPYADWTWPAAPSYTNTTKRGFYNLDARVRIESDPGTNITYFYSHQFWLIGGQVGYIGIQEGDIGRVVIFSIWGATGATPASGARCISNTDGAPGQSCRLPYNWVAGHTYRLRIWALSENSWGAWVMDTDTGSEQMVATITVPAAWNWLDSFTISWTEFYAANVPSRRPATCAGVPYTRAWFGRPTANGGSINPTALNRHISTNGECRNTKVTEMVDSGVHQEMGVGAGCTMFPGEILRRGDTRESCNSRTTLIHQTDGNVVLYGPSGWLWNSGTWGRNTAALIMQTDGNLVLYPSSGPAIWHTNTWGNPTALLSVQTDCNLVLYRGSTPLWHTNTWGCVRR